MNQARPVMSALLLEVLATMPAKAQVTVDVAKLHASSSSFAKPWIPKLRWISGYVNGKRGNSCRYAAIRGNVKGHGLLPEN